MELRRMVSFGLRSPFTSPELHVTRANAQVILGNVSMQADARVFVNGEISYAEQLRDGSVANDILHYVIRMSGLLRSFCNCFGIRNTLSVLTSPGSQNTCKFGAAAANNATLCGL